MGRGTLQTGKAGRSVKQGMFNPIGSLQSGRVNPANPAAPVGAPQFAGVTSWNWSAKSVESEADGTAIENWTDRHSGVIATQATVSARPEKNTVGGFVCLDFDGIDDALDATFAPDLIGGHTFFIVERFNATAGSNNGAFLLDEGGSGIDDQFQVYRGNTVYVALVGRNTSASVARFYASGVSEHPSEVIQMNTAHFVEPEGLSDGLGLWSARTLRDDAMGSPSAVSGDNPTRARFGQGFLDPFDGQVYEVVLYDSPLSLAQIEEVWDWLEGEWGGPF